MKDENDKYRNIRVVDVTEIGTVENDVSTPWNPDEDALGSWRNFYVGNYFKPFPGATEELRERKHSLVNTGIESFKEFTFNTYSFTFERKHSVGKTILHLFGIFGDEWDLHQVCTGQVTVTRVITTSGRVLWVKEPACHIRTMIEGSK